MHVAARVRADVHDAVASREPARTRHRAEHAPLEPVPQRVVERRLRRRVDGVRLEGGRGDLGVARKVAAVGEHPDDPVGARVGDEELTCDAVERHTGGHLRYTRQIEAGVTAHRGT